MPKISELPNGVPVSTGDSLPLVQNGTTKKATFNDLPISSATQTALNLKADASSISNVNNTSDANKPVSTAQAAAIALKQDLAPLAFGQCRLVKSGANLVLQRLRGQLLTINGTHQSIPSAGVSLAPTGAVANTTYYIYAWMNAGTMALEFSTTGHSTDATTGVEVKTGDSTRTLVGMARAITGPAWQDTVAQRFVVSYFNRRPIFGFAAFTSNRGTTSVSFVELNTEIRNEFLVWADDAVSMAIDGGGSINTTTNLMATSIGIDNTTPQETRCVSMNATINGATTVACYLMVALSEGYHYSTLLAAVDGGSGVWVGSGTPGARTSLKTTIQG